LKAGIVGLKTKGWAPAFMQRAPVELAIEAAGEGGAGEPAGRAPCRLFGLNGGMSEMTIELRPLVGAGACGVEKLTPDAAVGCARRILGDGVGGGGADLAASASAAAFSTIAFCFSASFARIGTRS
jgi:hypothetical protein